MPCKMLLGFVFLVIGLAACATPAAYHVLLDCTVALDELSETKAKGNVNCDVIPTPTPVPGQQITVIQPGDSSGFYYEAVCQPPDFTHSGQTMHDAFLVEGVPGTGWGYICNNPQATYKAYVGYFPSAATGDGEYRSVFKFPDLSAVPANAVVESVIFTAKQTWCQNVIGNPALGCSGQNMTIEAHQVQSGWHEWSTRWLNMPNFVAAPLDSAAVANVLGATLDLDITVAFNQWRTGTDNEGIILIANPLPASDFLRFRTHDTVCTIAGCSNGQGEPPGADGPKLTVTWHLP